MKRIPKQGYTAKLKEQAVKRAEAVPPFWAKARGGQA